MNPHQPKVVPQNGLMLGHCYRATCKCGWMGPLRPINTAGSTRAQTDATRDGEIHAKGVATNAPTPAFLIHLNETEFTVEEPAWKKQ